MASVGGWPWKGAGACTVADDASALTSIPLLVKPGRVGSGWRNEVVRILALRALEGVGWCIGVSGAEMVKLLGMLGGEVARWIVPVGLGRRGEGSGDSGLSGRHGRVWCGARMASGLWFTLTRLLARVSAVVPDWIPATRSCRITGAWTIRTVFLAILAISC